MSHKITLLPSCHEFEAEAQETVLDAAFRAGITLNYSCNSGSCGDCKAKLLEGDIGEELFHDYCYSAQDKLENTKLLCRIKAGSDLTLQVHEISDSDEIPVQRITAKVKKIERLSDEFMLLNLKTPRTQTLRFLAGQHVELRFSDGLKGDFSVASCPCNGRELQFHLYKNLDDELAAHAFNTLSVKDDVQVVGPFGDFIYQDDSPYSNVMICLDTGFAAIKSLMEHAIALDVSQEIQLFWISHKKNGHYLENYCRSWASVMDNFHYHLLSVENDDGSWREYAEVAKELASYLNSGVTYEIYNAVSGAMLGEIQRTFADAGINQEQWHRAKIRGQCIF